MKITLKRILAAAAVSALVASPVAQATNGYFKIGAGSKNRGMAGAGIAFGQDAMASAANPATLAGIGDRVDVGAEIFKPKRKGELDARGLDTGPVNQQIGPIPGYTPAAGTLSQEDSRSNVFFIPHLGISKAWGSNITLGIAITGNGGMNTRYGDANGGNGNIYSDAFGPVIGNCGGDPSATGCGQFPATLFSGFAGLLEAGGAPTSNLIAGLSGVYNNPNGSPALGVNLAQVLITPTIAYQINSNHSIGFSPVIGYQTFRAYGLGLFQGLSSDPLNVTNNGNDDALGFGAQVGYSGTFGNFTVGAMGRSKIYMDEFDDYSGLFAEQGDFDVPPVFGAGVAFRATPKLTIAADVSRIMYEEVDAISNKGPTADEFFNALTGALVGNPGLISNPLGTNDGWGFGWENVWVYKVGVNYEYNSNWTFRAGYNYAEMPYGDDQALFNILAPAVVEKHVTAGFTRALSPNSELTFTYMHAFRNDVDFTYQGTGQNAAFSFTAENDMYQNALELSYGLRF